MPTAADAKRSRPDAVTELLGKIWDDALDPGYAHAARTRARPSRPLLDGASTRPTGSPGSDGDSVRARRRAHVRAGPILALCLVGLLLGVALAQALGSRPAVARRRADLIAQIHTETAARDAAIRNVAGLQAQVDYNIKQQLSRSSAGAALNRTIDDLQSITGLGAVIGPGIQLVVDDAPGSAAVGASGGSAAAGRVLDRDLQMVVNGLWAAGAEAISVDGQRLTSRSAIRAAGDAILVDYRPLTRPYVIEAIGNPDTLQATFVAGPAGRGLNTLHNTYGIVEALSGNARLSLPAAASTPLIYARGLEGTP